MSTVTPRRVRAWWRPRTPIIEGRLAWIGVGLVLLFLAMAILGSLLTGDPAARTGLPLESPSGAHPLGTDHLGRDLFARVAAGAALSIAVGLSSVGIGLLLAVPAGIYAGLHGASWIDEAVMRVMDALQALPFFVFALFVMGLLGTGESGIGPLTLSPATKVVLLLAISFLPYFARVARSATLVEAQQDYVDALRVVGVPRWRIVFIELLPNVLPPVLVQGFLWIGIAIFAEAALSFLGMGIQPPAASLGSVIGEGTSYMLYGAWWYPVIPGIALLTATLGLNLVGDSISRALGRR